jgi:integrase/recombinase XerD
MQRSAGVPPHTTALAQAADTWLDELARRGRAENTLAAYRGDLRAYVRTMVALGPTEPAEVGPEDVEAFVLAFGNQPGRSGRPRSEATVARVLAAVRGLHAWMAQTGRTADDPAAGVATPQAVRSAPVALEPDQVALLLSPDRDLTGPGTEVAGVRDHALVVLLVLTGVRAAELVDLDVVDVSDDGRRIRVRGVRPRPLALPDPRPLRTWLARRVELAGDDPALFPNQRGERLTRQGVWRLVTAHCVAVGLPAGTSPRVLRNTFAAVERGAGTPEPRVRELLGTVPWTGAAERATGVGPSAPMGPQQ